MHTLQDYPMPRVLRYLIIATVGCALFAGLTEYLFTGVFGIPSLQGLLSMSRGGISTGFIWQPLTYLFVYQPYGGLGLGTLISIAFHMYILYMMGQAIYAYTGEKGMLKLYFGAGLSAALMALMLMFGFGLRGYVAGAGPAVFAVLMVWAMAYPGLSLMLFMMIPILARWLVAAFVGIHVLLTLSHGDLIGCMTYLTGTAFGYAYGVLACDMQGPWPALRGFDRFLLSFKEKADGIKIYDIRTGQPKQDDNAFMDEMLEKIAKHGEASLSRNERKRMDAISKKKR